VLRVLLAGGLTGAAGLAAPALGNVAPQYTYSERPSPVVLQPPTSNVYLRPLSFCWSGPTAPGQHAASLCGDGFAPGDDDLRAVTTGRRLTFWFGRAGWRFAAAVRPIGASDDQLHRLRTTRVSDHRFHIARPAPGNYRVHLAGRGPEGDVFVCFRWRVRG
jgi:hypothetical protein